MARAEAPARYRHGHRSAHPDFFAVTDKLRERSEYQTAVKESQCADARSRAKTAWDRYRIDLTLHYFQRHVAAQEQTREAGLPAVSSEEDEKHVDAIESTTLPEQPSRADLQRLRELADKSPSEVERPPFSELEAALAACE